ncbi:chaplin [Actinomadura madurae]|uniref:chaplin family protein n=1 Tax=Actinomadura madurae TaxID=1993 RepID=UPI00202729AF|nr:chaplin family protein [Actinomadura madurae]URM96995.1 chaplin [Actinomadura madurae]
MRKWAKSTSRAALVAAGALVVGAAFGSGPAGAATLHGGGHDGKVRMETSHNFGVLNGNQVFAPISIPVDVCGNAIAIAGISRAQCKGGATVKNSGGRNVKMESAGNFGIGNGNQVFAPISVPVDVCGNAVGVLGAAQAQCKGGATVKNSGGRKVKMKSAGNFGILNGNQAYIPISVPINACGNAVGALGAAEAQCKGGATVDNGHKTAPPTYRTPKKPKPYKPSKHRPAAEHTKLPSTMRADGSRVARPDAGHRTADAVPGVRGVLDTIKRPVKTSGVGVEPGRIAPRLAKGSVPVALGSPLS